MIIIVVMMMVMIWSRRIIFLFNCIHCLTDLVVICSVYSPSFLLAFVGNSTRLPLLPLVFKITTPQWELVTLTWLRWNTNARSRSAFTLSPGWFNTARRDAAYPRAVASIELFASRKVLSRFSNLSIVQETGRVYSFDTEYK